MPLSVADSLVHDHIEKSAQDFDVVEQRRLNEDLVAVGGSRIAWGYPERVDSPEVIWNAAFEIGFPEQDLCA